MTSASAMTEQISSGQIGQPGDDGAQQCVQRVVEIERATHRGRGFGEESGPARGFFGAGLGRLGDGQRGAFFGLPADLLRLLIQLDEDAHLGAENGRHDRRQNVIDRAQRIALKGVCLIRKRGDKDNRRALAAFALTDQRGRLKTVHVRHVHIEQDDGEVVFQQSAQRLAPRADADHVLPQHVEDRFHRQQLVGHVVDDQDVDGVFGRHGLQRLTQMESEAGGEPALR